MSGSQELVNLIWESFGVSKGVGKRHELLAIQLSFLAVYFGHISQHSLELQSVGPVREVFRTQASLIAWVIVLGAIDPPRP